MGPWSGRSAISGFRSSVAVGDRLAVLGPDALITGWMGRLHRIRRIRRLPMVPPRGSACAAASAATVGQLLGRAACPRSPMRRRRRFGALVRPARSGTVAGRDDVDGGAHQRVPGAAQLGALGRVVAEPGRRHPQVRRDPGHRVELLGELGTKKLWITSSERSLNTTGWSLGRYSIGRDDLLAARLRVGELERELPLGDVDGHRVRLVVLVGAQHGVGVACTGRRSGSPARAVQTTSSRVLPWIGGPSFSSSPGPHPELPDREQDDGLDQHEDRHRGDQQHVVERPDVAAWIEALAGTTG